MGFSDRLKKFEVSENIENIVQNSDCDEVFLQEPPNLHDFLLDALSAKAASVPVWYEYSNEQKEELILNFLDNKICAEFEGFTISDEEKRQIAEAFLKSDFGFGALDRILAKAETSALSVTSSGQVYVQTEKGTKKSDLILDKIQFEDIISRFEADGPVSKFRLNDFQITILKPPVSEITLIIRKVKNIKYDLPALSAKNIIAPELCEFLKHLLSEKKNIIISSFEQKYVFEFLQILLNSIDENSHCCFIEDCETIANRYENVSVFSLRRCGESDCEEILSVIEDMNFDYTAALIKDYKKFAGYYMTNDNTKSGLLTGIRALNTSDAVSKLTSVAANALKSSEKLAKLKLSSTYDYLIHLDKYEDSGFRIASIMEITSTKSSSLVTNEVAKFVDGLYVLDLPEDFYLTEDSATVEIQPPESGEVLNPDGGFDFQEFSEPRIAEPAANSFRARLNGI